MSEVFRDNGRIISDSEPEDDAHKVAALSRSPQHELSTNTNLSVPRLNFSNKTSLTPRRHVVFEPTPVKRLDFSNTKLKKTPGRTLEGLKFFKSPAPPSVNSGYSDDEGDDDIIVGSLNFNSLTINDETDHGCDVDAGYQDVFGNNSDSRELPTDNSPEPLDHCRRRTSPTFDHPLPANTSYLQSSPQKPVTTTSTLTESESESDWALTHTARKPGQPRRIVVSESEEELSPAPRRKRQPIIDLTGSGDESSEGEGSQDHRHYDDSYGSLREFIVDDSEGDDYVEAPTTDEDSEVGVVEPRKAKKKYAVSEDIPIDWEDDADEEGEGDTLGNADEDEESEKAVGAWDDDNLGILQFVPPRRPVQLASPAILTSSIDSDFDSLPESVSNQLGKPLQLETPFRPRSGISKKDWTSARVQIAQDMFDDLDRRVFDSKLGVSGAGARVQWNNRLLTTAGMANSKRVLRNGAYTKEHWIELSEKVLTGEERIRNTVAHEMCHLATWIISGDLKNPHGRIFKSWGNKVMAARKDVEVTTKHSYVIDYKYEWKCSNQYCGQVYKRQSKSIDAAKHACGSCRSKLTPLFETKQRALSAFQLYLKDNMKHAKAAMPGSSHGDVMRALSQRWTENPAGTPTEHKVHWVSIAAGRMSL